uniref:Uncharacterized protein n=1 Tax=Chelonoidis abingdonii TaxID=106734 RepID=A0A8C0HH91_CHEAB
MLPPQGILGGPMELRGPYTPPTPSRSAIEATSSRTRFPNGTAAVELKSAPDPRRLLGSSWGSAPWRAGLGESPCNLEVVQFLVENGADVNQADNEGWTPLHVAASCGYKEIAQ